jgi:hypothetical protein
MTSREKGMSDKRLMKWGGISALVFVALLTTSIVTAWVTGAGIAFRAWVPLWSTLVCFLVIAAIAGYDYVAKSHYALARVGLGFAVLAIIFLFLEGAVWGADRMVRRAEAAAGQPELTHLLALFNSLHMMVLWFIGLWLALWGAALVRLGGRAKTAGVLMLLLAGFNAVDYLLARLGQAGRIVDLWHLGGQIILLSAFTMLGLVLLAAWRESVQ